MTALSLEAQTTYAELLTHLLRHAHDEPAGSLVEKSIGGRVYLYVQHRWLGKIAQSYLGPDNALTRARGAQLMDTWQRVRSSEARGAELVRIGRAAGLAFTTQAETKLLDALATARVFAAGGVLVGTHAFVVLGNALGLSLEQEIIRTADIDIAHDVRIQIAVMPMADVTRFVGDGVDGTRLWPVPSFDRHAASTSFQVHGTSLHLDFLTPQRSRSEKPVLLPALNTSATPLPYLDYLLEVTMTGALIGGSGVLVHVPDPSRFAWHKLIVASARNAAFATKSHKDLRQAELLLRELMESRPYELKDAWDALEARGSGWVKKAESSLKRLPQDVSSELVRRKIKKRI